MDLAKYYATDEQIARHNEEARRVWEAYKQDRPIRVPVVWGGVDAKTLLMFDTEGPTFRDYYTDAATMMETQAKSAEASNRILLDDTVRTLRSRREAWKCGLDFWPFSDEAAWGCPVEFFDRTQPRVRHLYDREKVDPATIPAPDPFKDHFMGHAFRMFEAMQSLVKTKKYDGLPFDPVVGPGSAVATYGLFNTASQLRGTDIFLDFYEDPDYLRRLMAKVAEGYVTRIKAWSRYEPRAFELAGIAYDHLIDQISIEQYEEFLVPAYRWVKEQFGRSNWDEAIEHCGHGEHIIRYKHKVFGVRKFTNVNTAFIDVERLRHDLGEDVHLEITIHPGTVMSGPVERIREEVRAALRPAIKGKGRLCFIVQGDNFTAPLEHRLALYEAAKEYGGY